MATAQATRTRSRAKKVKVAPDDFQRIIRFLCADVLVEREREMPVLIRGTLAGVNIHQIGGGGLAKSLGLREFSKCVTNARYFEKALQPFTPDGAVIGPYDMAEYAKTGIFARNLKGYAGDAHIVFLDELLRASGAVRDAAMPLMNASERHVDANGVMVKSPMLVLVTASNTWFDPDDAYSQAVEDRVTLMQRVEDIKADDSFKELIRRQQVREILVRDGKWEQKRETITLEQLVQAQDESARVDAAQTPFLDAVADLRRKAKGKGLLVSPRRWLELIRVCKANAWMAGRDFCIPEDLIVVEDGLWRSEEHIPIARELVQEYRGKFEQFATDRRAEAEKTFARIEQIRSQVEGTPKGEEMVQEVLLESINAMREVAALKARVQENIDEAEAEKRAATDLHALMGEITALENWARAHNLSVF